MYDILSPELVRDPKKYNGRRPLLGLNILMLAQNKKNHKIHHVYITRRILKETKAKGHAHW